MTAYREAVRLRLKPYRVLAYRMAGQPEGWSAFYCLLWATWVFFMPPEPLVQHLYATLNRLLTNSQWVGVGLTVGLLQGGAVIRNKRYSRGLMALVAGLFWAVISRGLYLSDPSAPGAAMYLGNAILNISLCAMLLCPRR